MAEITKDTLIGDLLKQKAGADDVIRRYFGNGCFTCPAVTTEPLSMAAVMHGADLEALLRELNELSDGESTVQVGPQEEKRKPFFSSLFGKKRSN
jgi:hypothetical protein